MWYQLNYRQFVTPAIFLYSLCKWNYSHTSIMKDICMILKIDSYCLCENYTQSIIDIEGDVIAFADFSEKQE